MKEEVLTKAIELKKQLDYQRRVLKLGNSVYTSIKVYFEDELIHDNVLKELDGADLIDLNKVWHQAKDVMPPSIYGGNHADLLCVHQFKPTSHPHLTHEENCPEFEEYLKASPNDWWCRTGDLLKKEHRELYWR